MTGVLAVSLLLLQAEAAEPFFRSQAVDAHADVRVMQNGKPVIGLSAADFAVTGGGRELRVTSLAAEEQPLDILLVLDMSRSMQQWLALLAEYSDSAMALMRPADRVAVATFADNFQVASEFSHDVNAALHAVDKAALGNRGHTTKLDEVIRRSAMYVGRRGRRDARRPVVFVTDNVSPADADGDKLRADVLQSEAVFHALLPPLEPGMVTMRSKTTARQSDVRRYVELSGGDTIASTDRGPALAECIGRLRTRYTVYFRPEGDLPADVRVTLSQAAQQRHPGAAVQARMAGR